MIYQLYEAERIKSTAEQRVADARRGELAAAISRSIRGRGQRARALKSRRLHFYRAKRRATSFLSQRRPTG